jgi:hypothetical protein
MRANNPDQWRIASFSEPNYRNSCQSHRIPRKPYPTILDRLHTVSVVRIRQRTVWLHSRTVYAHSWAVHTSDRTVRCRVYTSRCKLLSPICIPLLPMAPQQHSTAPQMRGGEHFSVPSGGREEMTSRMSCTGQALMFHRTQTPRHIGNIIHKHPQH